MDKYVYIRDAIIIITVTFLYSLETTKLFFRIFFAVEKFFNEKKSFERNEKLATGSQLHLLVE